MTERREAKLVRNPKFKKFDGKYFKKRMREIRKSLPKGGM